ncbi:hypothetical protein ACOACQ_07720 [Nocardioides sp. CPCC 206347]|uniref:hypothetical protein n=1 Tax=unclassified Nocardioides TaxID=2615069 RepID=UPI0015FD8A6A|nr:hypothetical protein [Nocardioides sp. WS12]
MSALHTLDVRLYEVLAGARLPAAERDQVIDLCEYVVGLIPELDLPHPGRTTRSAVHLLLDDLTTSLDVRVRGDLARLCEVAVVRGLD